MARRSTKITLANNTQFVLTLLDKSLDHGKWTTEPPSQIEPRTVGVWESESKGIGTGTEGWADYVIQNTDSDNMTGEQCSKERVHTYWDNPMVWKGGTTAIDHNIARWEEELSAPTVYTKSCKHEDFDAGSKGHAFSVDWFGAYIIPGPIPLGLLTAVGGADNNLEFTIGLRKVGSVKETLLSFYDGRKGLLSLARRAKQQSLKTLFHL